jgi:hypothetical protein
MGRGGAAAGSELERGAAGRTCFQRTHRRWVRRTRVARRANDPLCSAVVVLVDSGTPVPTTSDRDQFATAGAPVTATSGQRFGGCRHRAQKRRRVGRVGRGERSRDGGSVVSIESGYTGRCPRTFTSFRVNAQIDPQSDVLRCLPAGSNG